MFYRDSNCSHTQGAFALSCCVDDARSMPGRLGGAFGCKNDEARGKYSEALLCRVLASAADSSAVDQVPACCSMVHWSKRERQRTSSHRVVSVSAEDCFPSASSRAPYRGHRASVLITPAGTCQRTRCCLACVNMLSPLIVEHRPNSLPSSKVPLHRHCATMVRNNRPVTPN